MRHHKLAVTVSCMAFVCIVSNLKAATIPESIKDNIRARVDGGWTVGVVVGVIDADGTEFFSYGNKVRGGDDAVDERSVFEIGSITKAFTGILLAEAVRRGEVKLDDPVQTLLPKTVTAPQRGGKQITLHDLVTHRSGLPRVPSNMELDLRDPYANYTADKLYAFLSDHELGRDIGSEYEYSNLGMGLLGHALALQQKQRYGDLVAKRITKPLGMSDTGVKLTRRMKEHLARGHQGNKEQPVENWEFDCLAGCGALRSTAKDMLRFLSANMGLTETPLAAAMRASHKERNSTNMPTIVHRLRVAHRDGPWR